MRTLLAWLHRRLDNRYLERDVDRLFEELGQVRAELAIQKMLLGKPVGTATPGRHLASVTPIRREV